MERPSLSGAEGSDLLNGSFCVGFLNGYLANLHQANAICTKGAPMSAVVRSYVAFMTKNPDLLTEDRNVGLSLALRDAYPCSTEPPPSSASGATGQFTL